jgi:mannitol/fructose-specific phosphotransferase system IIA component (Ntr-type)
MALNKQGLDFEAADRQPSKILVLLLTPQNESELQLKLLAEVANLFGNKSQSEEIINSESPEQVLTKITKIKSHIE